MSAEYYIHVLAKKKDEDKWHCIDPYVKSEDGKLEMSCTYSNGSRSYFSNTWEKLCELADYCHLDADKLTDDAKEELKDYMEPYYGIAWVDYDRFKACVPKDNEFSIVGFALKSELVEEEDDEYVSIISPKEYHKLKVEEQRCYQFIERDDYYGWKYYFKHIRTCVGNTIAMNYIYGDYDIALLCIMG